MQVSHNVLMTGDINQMVCLGVTICQMDRKVGSLRRERVANWRIRSGNFVIYSGQYLLRLILFLLFIGLCVSEFQIVKSLKPNYEIASLPVTPNMTVRDIRGQLVSCLQPEKRRFMNLDYRSRHAIFVDDFSIQTGQDDANLGDVIRQAMCSGTVLGVDGLSMVSAAGIQFILSAYPPPSWSTRDRDNQHFVNSRLRRMLCILNVYPHGLETLTHMLVPRFLKWLEGYPSLSDSKSLAKASYYFM